MKVYCLLTIPPGHSYKNCTMVLDTIRVGFPNAELYIDLNGHFNGPYEDLNERALKACTSVRQINPVPHFEWIDAVFGDNMRKDEPFVLVDGDVRFFEPMEDLDLGDTLTGMYIPQHFSDFARALTFHRLHTSLLFIRSGKELTERMKRARCWRGAPTQVEQWLRVDLIRPQTAFINSRPLFWDTCSQLFCAFGDSGNCCFREAELNKYAHLNSASFFEVMKDRFENEVDAKTFREISLLAESNPDGMRGLNLQILRYYHTKYLSLHDYLHYYPSQ